MSTKSEFGKENSPVLQRWVIVQKHESSPVRDESSFVPDGTCAVCWAGLPSHKWLGYFHFDILHSQFTVLLLPGLF